MVVDHIKDLDDIETHEVLSRLRFLYNHFDQSVLVISPFVFKEFLEDNNMAVKILQELHRCEQSQDYVASAEFIHKLLSQNKIPSTKLFPLVREINQHLGVNHFLQLRLVLDYDLGAHHDVLHFVKTAEDIRNAIKALYQQVYSPVHLRHRINNNLPLGDVHVAVSTDHEGSVVRGYVEGEKIYLFASSGLNLLHHGNDASDKYIVDKEYLNIVDKDIGMQTEEVSFRNGSMDVHSVDIGVQKIPDHAIMECARMIKKLSLKDGKSCEYLICCYDKGFQVVDVIPRQGVGVENVDSVLTGDSVAFEENSSEFIGNSMAEEKTDFIAQFKSPAPMQKVDVLLETAFRETMSVLRDILQDSYRNIFNRPPSESLQELVLELRTMKDFAHNDKLQVLLEMEKTKEQDVHALLRGITYAYQIIESFENA